MNKIAIVTILDGCNYGNRLQNYALYKVLSEMGNEVQTLKRGSSRDLSPMKRCVHFIKQGIRKCIGLPDNLLFFKRKHIFDEFTKKNIALSKYVLANNIAPNNINDEFDFFIVGSDQVWNANFDFVREDIKNYLLTFATPDKRVAYAASFGTNTIPEDLLDLYALELSKFNAISVRELEGANLIRNLISKEIEITLDPTMLLTKREWQDIKQKPRYINEDERFVLTYIMSTRTEVLDKHISEVASSYSAEVINLDIEFLDSDKIENKKHYLTSPSEFLWLIENAECVITDSFHACVFSLIYHKPLLLYRRQGLDMSNRIETLMRSVDSDCIFDDYNNPSLLPCECDFCKVDKLLEKARDLSYSWLLKTLEM